MSYGRKSGALNVGLLMPSWAAGSSSSASLEGRSAGYRVIIAYRASACAVFLYGFAKNEKDNISDDELSALRQIAADLFRASQDDLERMVRDNRLTELNYDEED